MRLLVDPDTIEFKAGHWTRCRRFAGKEHTVTPALIKSAHHDFTKFKIEDFVGAQTGKGEMQLLASWFGFEDHDNSWEDISQLIEDAPYRVRNYLADNAEGHPPLQAVYDAEYE